MMSEAYKQRLPEAAAKSPDVFEVCEAGPHCSPAAARAAARIGPNALIQVAAVLQDEIGAAETAALFAQAGLAHRLETPPQSLVPETEAIRLHTALRAALGPQRAQTVAREAGRRTADYLLANRIPRAARLTLRLLPARFASALLVKAITRHAWTFAGSGRFHAEAGRPTLLSISDCPLCRGVTAPAPVCDYYTATFERLFRVLVSADAYAVETACQAAGAEACRFEIRF